MLTTRALWGIGVAWLAGAALATGCATTAAHFDPGIGGDGGSGGSAVGGAGSGGEAGGGGANNPCGVDCAKLIQPPPCKSARCDEKSKKCRLVNEKDGAACEDGLFCTVQDTCNKGVCEGGPPNSCAQMAPECHELTCDEETKSCAATPAMDGAFCTPADKCQFQGQCSFGACVGQPNDCKFEPPPDGCHVMKCDPADGMCKAQPGNEGFNCKDGLDLCTVGKTCESGNCVGGAPKDCSLLTKGCNVGVCDTTTGSCVAKAGKNGDACDDLDSCTSGETCSNGTCSNGTKVTQCKNGDGCCPAGCSCGVDDSDCCLYWKPGVLQNVAPATLVGWKSCYNDSYDVDLGSVISTVLSKCPKNKLLMACKAAAATNYQLVAMGNRSDVLFDCGSSTSCTHVANGVGWYFSSIGRGVS